MKEVYKLMALRYRISAALQKEPERHVSSALTFCRLKRKPTRRVGRWWPVLVQGWGNDHRKACFGFVHPGGVQDRTWALTATSMELDVQIPAVTEAEVALPVLRFSGLGVVWGRNPLPSSWLLDEAGRLWAA